MFVETTERDYREHVIHYGAHEAATRGKWLGLYQIWKDGTKIFGSAVVSDFDTRDQARDRSRELAEEHVDRILADKA